MKNTKAYAAFNATSPLAPFYVSIPRPGPDEIQIQIQYCGICHTDVHQARNEWRRHDLSLRART